jgi:hypothetical protein
VDICHNKPVTTEEIYARFDVFTAVTMKNAVFWDVLTKAQRTAFFGLQEISVLVIA